MKVFARTPLNLEQVRLPRGQVYLIAERCKGCKVCVQFCPRQVLRISTQANSRGYHYPEVSEGKAQDCVHCEFCTLVCPEFAIFTLPVDGIPLSEAPR